MAGDPTSRDGGYGGGYGVRGSVRSLAPCVFADDDSVQKSRVESAHEQEAGSFLHSLTESFVRSVSAVHACGVHAHTLPPTVTRGNDRTVDYCMHQQAHMCGVETVHVWC